MKIASIHLKDFRRFVSLNVDFDPCITVIAARNGKGKTTVLEAVASALGPFVGAFDDGKAEHIKRGDARFAVHDDGSNAQQFPVVVEAQFLQPSVRSVRELRSPKGKTTTAGSSELATYGKQLQDSVRAGEPVCLPVICYYSSKRLWAHHKSTAGKLPGKSRTEGYQDCLSALSSFNQLNKWVQLATLARLQSLQRKEGESSSPLPSQLDGVARVVEQVLAGEGWSGFEFDVTEQDIVLYHPDHGRLPFSLLSDGIRAMTSLAADLARRTCQLNPHLGHAAPTTTTGIVLIDEVDLHLHPEWQQRVLAGLQSAFPCIQFIVSTHSPQVLSSVSHTNIRTIDQDAEGQWVAHIPQEEIVGLPSYIALTDVMNVDPRPPVEQARAIQSYLQLIEEGEGASRAAKTIRSQLASTYGEHHQVLRDADRLLRFQRIKERAKPGASDA